MYFLCSYVLEAERIVYFFPQFSQPKYIRTVTEGSIEFIKNHLRRNKLMMAGMALSSFVAIR